jgi:hypothetical protein
MDLKKTLREKDPNFNNIPIEEDKEPMKEEKPKENPKNSKAELYVSQV